MAAFLESTLYKESIATRTIALALDEGLASTTETFSVFYGERLPWWVEVTAKGTTGHGSRFLEPTAVGQLIELTNKALAFRQGQRDLLLGKHENCAHAVAAAKTLGDVTSLNITTLQAGVLSGSTYAYNCVPPTARCSLDIRIAPHMDPTEMKETLDAWCTACTQPGGSVEWHYIGGHGNDLQQHAVTNTSANPWYDVFCSSLAAIDCPIVPQVFPAATDSRFLRALGICALGFSPMRKTCIKLHEVDEYLPEAVYIEGVEVYAHLLAQLATVVMENKDE